MRIVIAHFGTLFVGVSGGVEKITCEFANAMVERGHEVIILYRDNKEGAPYFSLSPKVKTHNILFEKGRQVISEKLPARLRVWWECCRLFSQNEAQAVNAKYKGRQYGGEIRKYLEAYRPDVIVSCSIPSTKYVIDDAGTDIPVIQMIHADPAVQFPQLSHVERRAAEKCSAMQILLLAGVAAAKTYFPYVPLTVIGNVVEPAKKMAFPAAKKNSYTISCVGNICGRKNQKLLAEAFTMLAKDFPDWKVEFWGGGEGTVYAKGLEKYIETNHLSQVHCKGQTKDVASVYANSDIFCLPSRSEGFGLAVGEAMAAGLPCVGIKTCFGVKDLIADGKTGFLTESTAESLAEGLRKLMENPELRQKMGKNGMERIQKYAPNRIWDQWENLMNQVIKV